MSESVSPFLKRHIGPSDADQRRMLAKLDVLSLDALIEQIVPASIRRQDTMQLPPPLDEPAALAELADKACGNTVARSLIGQGYFGTHTPPVIARNVFENPGWYTAYTPYQPEISQGRLEVLFYFQTLVTELTGLAVAGASLLDEATAAAEAMALAHRQVRGRDRFLVSRHCHPQTLDVVRTRATPLGIEVVEFDDDDGVDASDAFAVLLQYPRTTGGVCDCSALAKAAHDAGALVIAATDLLALTLLTPPGQWGADIAVGSAQRFGVPLGFGGPHAGFLAATDKLKRNLPGRLVGQSIDAAGRAAYRLALQTREQHIRREKATSNICTAQALLAIMATLYACYHGFGGLREIATDVAGKTASLVNALRALGFAVDEADRFDTVTIAADDAEALLTAAEDAGFNLRPLDSGVGIALDETVTRDELDALLAALAAARGVAPVSCAVAAPQIATALLRSDRPLTQAVFNRYQSETEMMRYLRLLADRDIALDRAMIPLGSCTMKLNAASEMMPVSWPAFAGVHPFAPTSQTAGYASLIDDLEAWLCACTGYDAMSLQPNAGSQGEYAGLLAIQRYHASRGDHHRDVCLIPQSAHGTNPASAQMCGMRVVVVACDDRGDVDVSDLQDKIDAHREQLAAIMITYPSTHGVFEQAVRDICDRVHAAGGQVYIDGANLNAQVGLAAPGEYGGDVSHLNLHKTFCIPHGGGGPGVGPIGVKAHLAPFLPGHRAWGDQTGVVAAAPYGSASILPIVWMYLRMMGSEGLRQASAVALLSANYIARRIGHVFPVLYSDDNGRVAHECIIDLRPVKDELGVTVDDVAKRLIDFGFHAPTMSFPVAGTLMIEPTESESLAEVDRFCDAMLAIGEEIDAIRNGAYAAEDSPLRHAPHTASDLLADDWTRPYSRQQGAFPAGVQQAQAKYWPPVSRIDNVYGDRNLVCACPPLEDYAESA
ncbi:MAG: aminomethyl-transferring glycine dehydrogenase [Pseudomonadota bacterium]